MDNHPAGEGRILESVFYAVMGIALRVSIKGMAKLKAKLAKMKDVLNNPQVPLMQAAVQITGETQRNFDEGGRPEAWMPLSMMSLFIRAHRADGPQRTGGTPLTDTGRLKSSFIPFTGSDGKSFGVGTNVEYARLMQEGGESDAQDIPISSFTRRLRENQFENFSTGKIRKTKAGKLSSGRVRAYTLHLPGGATIPARPFFPRNLGELGEWGYQAKIKEIFQNYFNGPI